LRNHVFSQADSTSTSCNAVWYTMGAKESSLRHRQALVLGAVEPPSQTPPPPVSPLLKLPNELLFQVIDLLDLHDLQALSQASARLRSLVVLNPTIILYYQKYARLCREVPPPLWPCADCFLAQKSTKFRVVSSAKHVPWQSRQAQARSRVCWDCEYFRRWSANQDIPLQQRGKYLLLRSTNAESEGRPCASCLKVRHFSHFGVSSVSWSLPKHPDVVCLDCRIDTGELFPPYSQCCDHTVLNSGTPGLRMAQRNLYDNEVCSICLAYSRAMETGLVSNDRPLSYLLTRNVCMKSQSPDHFNRELYILDRWLEFSAERNDQSLLPSGETAGKRRKSISSQLEKLRRHGF
jgi:hypothetical protein